jgi:hypothetical protein
MVGLNLKVFKEVDRECEAFWARLSEADQQRVRDDQVKIEAWRREAAASGDVDRILLLMGNHFHLAFIADNIAWLKAKGEYERALMDAYTGTRINFSGWSPHVLRFLFQIADRDKLRAAGDPIPGGGPFMLYRGVAGSGAKRRVRGMSWTSSLDKAQWFAKRFGEIPCGVCPTVYEAQVSMEHVYAYSNGRSEQEFLCDIPKELKLKKVWPNKRAK